MCVCGYVCVCVFAYSPCQLVRYHVMRVCSLKRESVFVCVTVHLYEYRESSTHAGREKCL